MIRYSRFSRFSRFVLLAAAGLVIWSTQDRALGAQSDLDAFMREVMERRDDNWKKLQQYILDEREQFDLRGPGRLPALGRAPRIYLVHPGRLLRPESAEGQRRNDW